MGEGFWFSVATDAGALVFAGQQQPATLSEFSFSMREKVAVRPDEGEEILAKTPSPTVSDGSPSPTGRGLYLDF